MSERENVLREFSITFDTEDGGVITNRSKMTVINALVDEIVRLRTTSAPTVADGWLVWARKKPRAKKASRHVKLGFVPI